MQARVLIVDDHASARQSMADILGHAGHRVHTVSGAAEALHWLEGAEADVVLSDLKMPGMDGLEFLRHLHQREIDVPVIMITAHATVASAVEAMRYGAFDYIEKPFTAGQLESVVRRALRHAGAVRQHVPQAGDDLPVLIGSSAVMHQLRQRIRQVAATEETVLIWGESGTGKELVARRIHAESPRAQRPFISLNCPALSPQLMESELFGHERGAFTGADSVRVGRFELADGGTLLLDEITEIDVGLQAKLLRVLQEKTYERVGSSTSRRADVRVLATTNRPLYREVEAGRFRLDLFYRLHVLPIEVPPLRNRRDDIPELLDYFRHRAAKRLGCPPIELTAGALDRLVTYHWPGNVRELENFVTRVSVLHPRRELAREDVHAYLTAYGEPSATAENLLAEMSDPSPRIHVGLSIQEMERRLIEATLDHFGGHRVKAAQALGIGVRTLTNKLRQYGYAPRAKRFTKSVTTG